jgi:hypothetical protein
VRRVRGNLSSAAFLWSFMLDGAKAFLAWRQTITAARVLRASIPWAGLKSTMYNYHTLHCIFDEFSNLQGSNRPPIPSHVPIHPRQILSPAHRLTITPNSSVRLTNGV